jgi:hypothetical protein
MIMPFGKYKGKEVRDIPVDYLRWAHEKCDLYGRIKDEIEALVAFRPAAMDAHHFGIDLDKARSIYRELSFQYHPDRGGSTSAMQALNTFYNALKEVS